MPIYEYACSVCQHQFEKIQKVDAPLLIQCPECQQDTLKRLLSKPSFRLKGTGWYETDFKNKAPKSEIKKENSTAEKNSTDDTAPKTEVKNSKPTDADSN